MNDTFDFSGKTAFVAGGSSGINLAIADAFAARGARVAIVSRSQERVEAAVRQLQAHGGMVAGFAADVREAAAIAEALRRALVLSSELASFATGAIVPVDGGSSLGGGRNLGGALNTAS